MGVQKERPMYLLRLTSGETRAKLQSHSLLRQIIITKMGKNKKERKEHSHNCNLEATELEKSALFLHQ